MTPRFRLLASGRVQQTDPDGSAIEFDAAAWADYVKANGKTVKAVRIPKPFQVAGDLCKDGWLVRDGRGLMAISNASFCREYEQALMLGEPPAVEAA